MKVSLYRRLGVPAVAMAVLASVAGCQGGDGKAADAPADRPQWSSATQVIQAAYEKTAAAKSARVRMTMSLPAGVGGPAGSGEMEMAGVLGWDPGVMDITVTGGLPGIGAGAGGSGGSGGFRMVAVDDVMYMDMSGMALEELGGKRWMKLDFKALGEKAGDDALRKQLTGSLESMNQDPAQQLALLLASPNLKHVGPEKVDGVDTQHYEGTLTVDEVVASNKSLSVLSDQEREELVAKVKESGLTAYDTEVWVNGDGYPVRMDVGMEVSDSRVEMSVAYSDYGTKAAVQAPPAGQTFDFMEMMGKLSEGAKGAEGTGGAAA